MIAKIDRELLADLFDLSDAMREELLAGKRDDKAYIAAKLARIAEFRMQVAREKDGE